MDSLGTSQVTNRIAHGPLAAQAVRERRRARAVGISRPCVRNNGPPGRPPLGRCALDETISGMGPDGDEAEQINGKTLHVVLLGHAPYLQSKAIGELSCTVNRDVTFRSSVLNGWNDSVSLRAN